jgi:nitrogen fixation NifU-like protein
MSGLRELYQEIILDHSRAPRNSGTLPDASLSAEGYNPLCGDRLTVTMNVDDGAVSDIRIQVSGCAICSASASTMSEAVKGQSLPDIQRLFEAFHDVLTGKAEPSSLEALGKLAVFGGVAEFPMRVKCATLPWHTLRSALEGEATAKTE